MHDLPAGAAQADCTRPRAGLICGPDMTDPLPAFLPHRARAAGLAGHPLGAPCRARLWAASAQGRAAAQGGSGDAGGPAGRPADLARHRVGHDRLRRARAAAGDRPQPRGARDRSGADRPAVAGGRPGPVGAHPGRARPDPVADHRLGPDLARAHPAHRAGAADRAGSTSPIMPRSRRRWRGPRPLRRGGAARLPFDAAAPPAGQ